MSQARRGQLGFPHEEIRHSQASSHHPLTSELPLWTPHTQTHTYTHSHACMHAHMQACTHTCILATVHQDSQPLIKLKIQLRSPSPPPPEEKPGLKITQLFRKGWLPFCYTTFLTYCRKSAPNRRVLCAQTLQRGRDRAQCATKELNKAKAKPQCPRTGPEKKSLLPTLTFLIIYNHCHPALIPTAPHHVLRLSESRQAPPIQSSVGPEHRRIKKKGNKRIQCGSTVL